VGNRLQVGISEHPGADTLWRIPSYSADDDDEWVLLFRGPVLASADKLKDAHFCRLRSLLGRLSGPAVGALPVVRPEMVTTSSLRQRNHLEKINWPEGRGPRRERDVVEASKDQTGDRSPVTSMPRRNFRTLSLFRSTRLPHGSEGQPTSSNSYPPPVSEGRC